MHLCVCVYVTPLLHFWYGDSVFLFCRHVVTGDDRQDFLTTILIFLTTGSFSWVCQFLNGVNRTIIKEVILQKLNQSCHQNAPLPSTISRQLSTPPVGCSFMLALKLVVQWNIPKITPRVEVHTWNLLFHDHDMTPALRHNPIDLDLVKPGIVGQGRRSNFKVNQWKTGSIDLWPWFLAWGLNWPWLGWDCKSKL